MEAEDWIALGVFHVDQPKTVISVRVEVEFDIEVLENERPAFLAKGGDDVGVAEERHDILLRSAEA